MAIHDHSMTRTVFWGQWKSNEGLNNNAGLASKASEEIARESTENRRFRQSHCRLTAPLQGTWPETIVIELHLHR